MKETSPVAAKPIAPAFNKRAIKDSKGPQQATSQEMECTPEKRDKSPPKRKRHRSTRSTLESGDFFEATTADAGREISMLLSQFAEVLRKSAAADTAQMKKLQGILTEARNLESYLKEKKNHLRHTLAQISDNLQG
ncbi:unnamed protein product [Pleuronectes platessa]|uniref:Uncharacterized protein n=1 Tax=Pleuronectes platessa TaxID=8262 RepID=A0A9N7ZE41_PLEPL|nr:unnamed protein product [Pleuronectes platessa]